MQSEPQGPVSGVAETSATDPAGAGGQSAAPSDAATGQAAAAQMASAQAGQATQPAPDNAEPSFFDPNTVPEELKPAYKQMQAQFTKRMQAISKDRQKIEAYDSFMSDPVGQLQNLASQYGFSITRGQAQQALQQQQAQQQQDWQPQSWDDVMARATELAEQRVLQKLSPVIGNVQQMHASSIEAQLDKLDSNWRNYEDDMRQNLREHPSLVRDVAKLYRLSVPEEVSNSRATQAALAKLQAKTQQAQVGGKSSTSVSAPSLKQAASFEEAVQQAREMLRTKHGG